MRFTKYTKWTGASWDEISLEELMEALSDYLLRSGFHDRFRRQDSRRRSMDWDDDEFDERTPQDALESLRRAIRQALRDSGLLDEEQYNQLFDENGQPLDDRLDELIDRLILRLLQEGYLSLEGDPEAIESLFGQATKEGRIDAFKQPKIKFEITGKGRSEERRVGKA